MNALRGWASAPVAARAALLAAAALAAPASAAPRATEGEYASESIAQFETRALAAAPHHSGDAASQPTDEATPAPAGDADPPGDLESIDDSWLDEDDLGSDPAERDHAPRWNRRVFAFNENFLRWVMRPISRGYQAITPEFVREMIVRGFDNLESPVILANDLMQLDACRAGRTLGRFALNSTAGLLGFFDVASEMGIERHDTDFGETLGRFGVRSGSFFMLPILGPSTARDTFGEVVDTALRPEVWLLGGFPRLAVTGSDGLSTYDIQAERLDALRETSVDFYAALRSAYLMDRDARVEDLRAAGRCGTRRKRPGE